MTISLIWIVFTQEGIHCYCNANNQECYGEVSGRQVYTTVLFDGTSTLKSSPSRVVNKYICAVMFHVVGVFDSTTLLGICLRSELEGLWKTSWTLPAKLFFEFFLDLFAMILRIKKVENSYGRYFLNNFYIMPYIIIHALYPK